MKITREDVRTLWDEIMPLLFEHWSEIARYKDIPLDPDRELYAATEEAGALRVFTARSDEGTLLGYAVYFVRPNPHYRKSLQAVQDVLFLTKEARKGYAGYKLIMHADDVLQEEGVEIVYHHVKLAQNFGPILERIGYEPVDVIYARDLRVKSPSTGMENV